MQNLAGKTAFITGAAEGIGFHIAHLFARQGMPVMLSDNVASMAGTRGLAHAGPNCATKAAVVSLSENWQGEFQPAGIGISVLCPVFAKSRMYCSERNRQHKYGGPPPADAELSPNAEAAAARANEVVKNGIETLIVADRVLEAVLNNELYVFTHPHYRPVVEGRSPQLRQAFDAADTSPALETVERGEIALL